MPGLPKGSLNDKLFTEHDYQYTPRSFLMSRKIRLRTRVCFLQIFTLNIRFYQAVSFSTIRQRFLDLRENIIDIRGFGTELSLVAYNKMNYADTFL